MHLPIGLVKRTRLESAARLCFRQADEKTDAMDAPAGAACGMCRVLDCRVRDCA